MDSPTEDIPTGGSSLEIPRTTNIYEAWRQSVHPTGEKPTPRLKGGRGYLMVDERASGGELKEFDTLTCAHCEYVVVLNAERKRARNSCKKCNKYVCDKTFCILECNPMDRDIELSLIHPVILARGKNGKVLHDPIYQENARIYKLS